MSSLAVARNYGGALFELASREGVAEDYGARLDALVEGYLEDRKFRAFLETPRVPLREKQRAIRKAVGDHVPGLMMNFLLVVLEKRRQRALPAIAAAYNRRLDRSLGRIQAQITLPHEPDEALSADIVEMIERRVERKVVPQFERDPKLIGGMVVQVGDKRMDASIRHQLENMKRQLADGHVDSQLAVDATER